MSNETVLSDEYVAELMALEAQDCSVKYSTMGLEAFRSSKPKNLAKPNTRFLRQIIRETTNHNAALLAKEAQESQARLDDLTSANEAKQRRLNPGAGDIRRRQLGDISAILSGRKRNRTVESPVADERDSGTSDTGHEDDDPLDHFIGPFPAVQPTVRGRGRISTASAMDKRFSDSYDPRSDTQPDDDYSEGIGSGGGSKDWDESAEAYRDRQKWKQQGAARLRVAGFTEEQIKKWEKGGPSGEKDLDDVRWRKAGEDREWDRGKVVGVDGTTTLALGWPARLD
ncbi:hypothetical protein P8C59_001156 [Phyllachora maydis]|uniref:Pre-mRNA-splicing factor 38B n=1 Tax=Phyllachora maydis TaxID=1825666 RepID=A0AAD9MBZ9_9PEZI|nr:hypothetical protein P8C59_001156 [Phyllachora maydis]